MKEKYIDELVGTYYLFPEGAAKSDIATSRTQDDIARDIPTAAAKALVVDRDKLYRAFVMAIDNCPANVLDRIRDEIYTKSD
jgi:hypothetical protein